ncbi:putative beta-galactosidase, partial [Aureobasidium pullulans]
RPGPYINAEVSGGGFPGWLARNPGIPRTRDPRFLNATDNYSRQIGEIIAKAQITEGGPVILYQPENEYSQAVSSDPEFPDQVYMAAVEKRFRDAGIVVPSILNDAYPHGFFSPGSGVGAVDIYGHDGYPLGFDCANPTTWPDNALPTYYGDLHAEQSPSTPYSILEFQGGSFDPWGGLGFEQCSELLNSEFQRVFYKNDFSFGMTIFNIYMTYGGTNWGNQGHPGGYTSYDYGAVITEERLVSREKYSEAKLEANFLQASPAYLTAIPQNNTHANGSYSNNPEIAVTALFGNRTNFFVIRHAAYNSLASTEFKLTLPTSQGNITIPQLNGSLVLNGRDSKWAVTDYDAAGTNLLYSSAEIFTQKAYGDKQVLVVYSGANENHELAFTLSCSSEVIEGSGITIVFNFHHCNSFFDPSLIIFLSILSISIGQEVWKVNRQSGTNINRHKSIRVFIISLIVDVVNISFSLITSSVHVNHEQITWIGSGHIREFCIQQALLDLIAHLFTLKGLIERASARTTASIGVDEDADFRFHSNEPFAESTDEIANTEVWVSGDGGNESTGVIVGGLALHNQVVVIACCVDGASD